MSEIKLALSLEFDKFYYFVATDDEYLKEYGGLLNSIEKIGGTLEIHGFKYKGG